MREGLRGLLADDFELVGHAANGRELVDECRRLKPDVAVADISMPLLNGIDAARQIREEGITTRIVFLTMHPDMTYATRALDTGASGYVLKHAAPEELVAAITRPEVDIYVLYVGGEPAGFVELNRQAMPEINIDYFGLMPQFTGRGYGAYFLNWAVDQAWSLEAKRLTVASSSLDDPRGLRTYQKAGFVPFRQDRAAIVDPRALGLIPEHHEPRRF